MVAKTKKTSKVPAYNAVEPSRAATTVPSRVPGEKTIEQLIRELKDPNERVRSVAAGELGHRQAQKAVEPLILALKDPHVWVRHGAAWALGEIRSVKAVDALRQALNDVDEITRKKAAEALEKIPGA